MTIRRHSHAHFKATPAVVAKAVRSVLAQRPPYVRADEVEKDALFSTDVRPGWWLSGTDMMIQLHASPDGTFVTAETKSQFFIVGDVFGFYDRYIQRFLSDVRRELKKQ